MRFESWEDKAAFAIPVLVLLILLAMIIGPSIDWKSINWSLLIENGGKLITALALIVGGIWTYYLFVKNRVYKTRLEPEVSSEVKKIGGQSFIVITLKVKNVGAAKVLIQRPTAIEIYLKNYRSLGIEGLESVFPDDKEPDVTFEAFCRHQWIESGETVSEKHVIAVPDTVKTFIKIELHIHAAGSIVTAMTLLTPSLDEELRKAYALFE